MNKRIIFFVLDIPFKIFSLLRTVKKINRRASECKKVFYKALIKNGVKKKIAKQLANFYANRISPEIDIFEFLKNFRVP